MAGHGMLDAPLTRRGLLGGAGVAAGTIVAASALSPERALAATMPAGWELGFADVENDVAPAPMRLVQGRAPAGFAGKLYRNGPAKFRRPGGSSQHWFDGDGLVRRYAIADGKAVMAARFVDTPKRRQETRAGAMIVPGFGTPPGPGVALTSNDDASAANISVMMAGPDLWALWEAGSPMRIDPETLATHGFQTLGAQYEHMPFLAHPRVEPGGRIWNLGQSGSKLIVWQLARDGRLEKATPVELPRASYIHDFTATARHIVVVLQPWVQVKETLPMIDGFSWQPATGTRVLVLDKADLTRRRVFELPSFSFFHLGDAWEERDGTIRFDACIERDLTFATTSARAVLKGRMIDAPLPVLAMIALHPDGRGELIPTRIGAEFPRCDPRRAGSERRYTAHVKLFQDGATARGIGVYDWRAQREAAHDFGADQLAEEFVMVPDGADEGSGWLIGTTLNLTARATELHLFRLSDIAAGPIATWRGDAALPISFHGIFVA